jgi:hypothetical protein
VHQLKSIGDDTAVFLQAEYNAFEDAVSILSMLAVVHDCERTIKLNLEDDWIAICDPNLSG